MDSTILCTTEFQLLQALITFKSQIHHLSQTKPHPARDKYRKRETHLATDASNPRWEPASIVVVVYEVLPCSPAVSKWRSWSILLSATTVRVRHHVEAFLRRVFAASNFSNSSSPTRRRVAVHLLPLITEHYTFVFSNPLLFCFLSDPQWSSLVCLLCDYILNLVIDFRNWIWILACVWSSEARDERVVMMIIVWISRFSCPTFCLS